MSLKIQIRTSINSTGKSTWKECEFVSYSLEKCSINNELVGTDIPYPSQNFYTSRIANRLTKKLNFSFSVVAKNFPETIINYNSLEKFIKNSKPSYVEQKVKGIYKYSALNNIGNVKIMFDGFVEYDKSVHVNVSNFSYAINQELGFVYYNGEKFSTSEGKEISGNKSIYPIGFTFTIDGDVPMTALDSIRTPEKDSWEF